MATKFLNLTIRGVEWLGLFGDLRHWNTPASEVRNLGLVDVNIAGFGYGIGALAGRAFRVTVTGCYSIGSVSGSGSSVGGLLGGNGESTLTFCYSIGSVGGKESVGGLVGENDYLVTCCYSTSEVRGDWDVGGLVGYNDDQGDVNQCFSKGSVIWWILEGQDYPRLWWELIAEN
ncbi:MAG: hypothetical protein ISS70_26540 [Phycisphaerae bacterium]|nr:hypothetical protein [Phycisphaerae bacterium]